MSEPWVTRVTIQGDELLLTVQVDEFVGNEPLEVSGSVTQHGGAIATVFDVQPVVKNPDGTATMYVKATPAQEFMEGDPVTVFLRAAKVWVTVLREEGWKPENQPTKPATDGTTWDTVAKVGWAASNGQASSWSPDQALAGGEPSFQG